VASLTVHEMAFIIFFDGMMVASDLGLENYHERIKLLSRELVNPRVPHDTWFFLELSSFFFG